MRAGRPCRQERANKTAFLTQKVSVLRIITVRNLHGKLFHGYYTQRIRSGELGIQVPGQATVRLNLADSCDTQNLDLSVKR